VVELRQALRVAVPVALLLEEPLQKEAVVWAAATVCRPHAVRSRAISFGELLFRHGRACPRPPIFRFIQCKLLMRV
jgi:hypothetical protein